MPQGNVFKKIYRWFFEEEKEEAKPVSNDAETVEIKPWQIIAVIAVSAGMFWYFFSPAGKMEKGFDPAAEVIKTAIEKNYFAGRKNIENGDFSSGFRHWNTADGGEIFRESQSKASLDNVIYRSPPYSLYIESIVPSNHFYYSKEKNSRVLENPYDPVPAKNIWMGVLPGSKINAALWYKGDVVTFYLLGLTGEGMWFTIESVSGPATDEWRKLKISAQMPENGRAVALEITLNRAEGQPLPRVWIDDVSAGVE